ncbi:MAG: uroporphyrinogen-III C-methyltransferase [Actinomycetota bacterium]
MGDHRAFMVSLRLAGRRVVVVGGDGSATAKVETLLECGAIVVVIDPNPSDRLADLAEQGRIDLLGRRVRRRDLRGAMLVIISDGLAERPRVARWARRAGALVNTVDTPDLCDVTIPSSIDLGPATIAISTNGATPAGARFLREQITAALPEGLDQVMTAAASARAELRASGSYRYDYARWRDHLFEPAHRHLTLDGPLDVDRLRERFVTEFAASAGDRTPVGSVSLVGAGPGGADLITLRGARALRSADVVLYDGLADPSLLRLAPIAAEKIPVEKRKGRGSTQDAINTLLIEHARAGRRVVRLKGGDPFVFGRGAEEVAALVAADISVEVIPGLSSSLAGPALAGIPVTDRQRASAVTVVSGHRAGEDDYDWEALARSDATLVVLMAATTAAAVADRLIHHLEGDHPVAFIHRAGHIDQQVAHTTLADAAQHGSPYPSPTIVVAGQVAAEQLEHTLPAVR